MGTGEFTAGGNPAMDKHPIQGGVEILVVASCDRNRDKLRPDGPLGSYADITMDVDTVLFSLLCEGFRLVLKFQVIYTCFLR